MFLISYFFSSCREKSEIPKLKVDEGNILQIFAMPDDANRPFKYNGTPPKFDLDEYKDTFHVFECSWGIFLRLSNIIEALDAGRRPQYTADVLLSCFSPTTLQTVLSMGLTEDELKNHETILKKLKERCKSGRNQHVWRHEFNNKRQLPNQSFDDYYFVRTSRHCCKMCIQGRLL